ncbi:MAG: Ger(x)C family spore germination protein [Tumebacillaceae bacterium]
MKPHRLHRARSLLLLLVISVAVAGCARQNILENLGLAISAGYDLAKDGKMIVTISMPEVSEEAKEKTQTLTAKGDLTRESGQNLSQSTDHQVVNGQLRSIIFSEALARKGLWRSLDTILRDVNITSNLIICISDGKARDVLMNKSPSRPSSGRYLFELLRKEARNYTIPRTTVHDFERNYYDIGSDPLAPYIRLHEGNIIAAGTALFKDDKYVGFLSPEDTKLLLLLQGTGEGGDIKQTLNTFSGGADKPDQVMLTFVRTKHKLKTSVVKGKAVMRYSVKVSGQVIEYTGDEDLTDDKVMHKVESRIEKGLTTRMQNLVERLQHEYKCDPLAAGDHIRALGAFKPWDQKMWRKQYENADIKISFKLRIIRTGITK